MTIYKLTITHIWCGPYDGQGPREWHHEQHFERLVDAVAYVDNLLEGAIERSWTMLSSTSVCRVRLSPSRSLDYALIEHIDAL